MGSRGMELSEIKMLCDAVNAAQFISEEKSFQLIDKLFSPLSDYQKEEIRNLIQQPSENKADSKSIYYADIINTAITQRRKIRFQYYEYNEKREKFSSITVIHIRSAPMPPCGTTTGITLWGIVKNTEI